MASQAMVVVAVDFGTTFSGFAYARTSQPDYVFTVYEWPGATRAEAKPYCKTQTSLFYAPTLTSGSSSHACFHPLDWGWPSLFSYMKAVSAFENSGVCSSSTDAPSLKQLSIADFVTSFQISSRDSWESSSPGHSDILALPPQIAEKVGFLATKFKLLLAPDAHRDSSLPKLPGGLTAELMVEDYLRCLKDFIISELQLNYGSHFSIKDVQWCLTVPAIWEERSKQVMKVCAEKAGMVQGSSCQGSAAGSPFPVDIILEPEAASVYCQHKSKHLQLRKGDKMLVADVGGGTIDLVVHEKADDNPESMQVLEVVSSYGDLGGGTYVDADFFKNLCQKIGCFKQFSCANKSTVLKIYQWWQGIKTGFEGEGYSAQLTLPRKLRKEWEKYEQVHQIQHDDDDYYEELRLEGSEIKAILDTEVGKVINLIRKQVEGIRVLMVVGGFSISPYLRHRIIQAFESRVEHIILPENPGSAICHGAVQLHLKKDIIQSRIAKRTYGIRSIRNMRANDPTDLLFKNDDGVWKCEECIDVFVQKGERVPLEASITRSHYPACHGEKVLHFILVSSVNEFPEYLREEGVITEGTFCLDISQDMQLDKGRRVDVTMVFGASMIEVTAERGNFGQPGKEKGLSVTFLKD